VRELPLRSAAAAAMSDSYGAGAALEGELHRGGSVCAHERLLLTVLLRLTGKWAS